MSLGQGMAPPLTTQLTKPKKYDDQMSRSSFSSVNSNSVRILKDHARVLNKESLHGNMVSTRVKDRVQQQHFQELVKDDSNMRQFNSNNGYGWNQPQQMQNNWSNPHMRNQLPLQIPLSGIQEREHSAKNQRHRMLIQNMSPQNGPGYNIPNRYNSSNPITRK